MANRSNEGRKTIHGFTLIELLVVIGIVGILSTASLFVDLNSFRGDAFRAEVNSLGVALQTARADALNNINEEKHGVAIHPAGCTGYVIFEGNSSTTANHALDNCIEASYRATISAGSPTEVVFDQLSGNASFDGDITLIDSNRSMTAVLSINHEGRISW